MKSLLPLALLMLSVFASAEQYQLGFILGGPTGLSAKYQINETRSVDAAFATSLRKKYGIEFHSNYLFEKQHAINFDAPAPLNVYYGIGGRLIVIDSGKHDGDIAIGPRFPIGLTYDFNSPNIQLFGELAPVLDIFPDTSFDLEAGIGARIRF